MRCGCRARAAGRRNAGRHPDGRVTRLRRSVTLGPLHFSKVVISFGALLTERALGIRYLFPSIRSNRKGVFRLYDIYFSKTWTNRFCFPARPARRRDVRRPTGAVRMRHWDVTPGPRVRHVRGPQASRHNRHIVSLSQLQPNKRHARRGARRTLRGGGGQSFNDGGLPQARRRRGRRPDTDTKWADSDWRETPLT